MPYPFMIRIFLTAFLGFWFCNAFAQKLLYVQIDITATNAFKGSYLFISIYNYSDSTKITYKIKDSIDNKGLKEDTQYMALQNYKGKFVQTKENEDTVLKIMREFVAIGEKHTHYSKDSISFNNYAATPYIRLLN